MTLESGSPVPKDELYRKHMGEPWVDEKLNQTADRVEAELGEENLTSEKADLEINSFAQENSERLPQILQKFFEAYLSSESSRSSGHEASHIYDNLLTALESFKDSNLTEVQQLEIALACIGHDLGRFVEPSLKTLSRDRAEVLMPFVEGRKLAQELSIPDKLGLRVLYDIANAKRNSTRLETQIVSQCDRAYVLGAPVFIRDLAFGLIRANEDYPMRMPTVEEMPEYEDYKQDLKNPYRERVPLKHFHFEFMMRNVFSPSTENLNPIYDRRKVETAVILMLAANGRPEVYNTFFAPEEGIVPEEELGRFKKKIKSELYEQAKAEYEEFLSSFDQEAYQLGDELTLAKKAMAIEKIISPKNFDQIFASKVSTYSEMDRRNLWLQIHYAIKVRHSMRILEMAELGEPKGEIEKYLYSEVRKEMDDRERIYNELYADGVNNTGEAEQEKS